MLGKWSAITGREVVEDSFVWNVVVESMLMWAGTVDAIRIASLVTLSHDEQDHRPYYFTSNLNMRACCAESNLVSPE